MKKPIWLIKVKRGLELAVKAARSSFYKEGVVIGFTEDDSGNKTGYIIRMSDKNEAGYYSKEIVGNKPMPIGVRVKNRLPEPEMLMIEPELGTFIYEVLREQVKLVPRIWLRRQIRLLLDNQEMSLEETSFKKWVLLSQEKKENIELIKVLEAVTKFEGLRGLARFNDYATKITKEK
jgi:hypothetical protein